MPAFSYRALTAAGEPVAGVLEAADRKAASAALRTRGLTPLALREGADAAPAPGTPRRAKADFGTRPLLGQHPVAGRFFQKLDRLVGGGLPPGDAVKLLSTKTTEPALRALAEEIWKDLAEGRTLADSVRRFAGLFEPGEAGLIEAGEATGTLPAALKRVLLLRDSREELRKKITAALAYPALVCGLAGVTIALFVFHLLPKLEGMMRGLNAEFSGASAVLITLARGAVYGLPVFLAFAFLALLRAKTLRDTPAGRLRVDTLLLRLPLAGPIVKHAELSGLAGLLGTLLVSGVPATDALRLAEKPVNNEVIRLRLIAARRQISEGISFSQAFRRHALLEDADADILTVNESTGSLHTAFEEIARAHFAELDAALRRLVHTLSAVFLGTAFAVVFFCLVSVVLSVLQVSRGMIGA